MALVQEWTGQMSSIDKLFYQELGQRIAAFRKAQEITQVQLAEILGISQQTVAHYEVGRLRISVELLTVLAKTLSVSIEEIIEAPTPNSSTVTSQLNINRSS